MGADMRIAIVENTKVTHHGQVGVALHEKGAVMELYRPFLPPLFEWRDPQSWQL
jgi:hypothetical protein